MRMFDDRYSRERRRFEIALRFIQFEARTHTIRAWTGLTDDRIRKLYRSYLSESQAVPLARHRGKSPQQSAFFTRSARARQESAVLASLWRLLGALPALQSPQAAQRLPGLNRGELLCQGYDSYRALIPAPLISFEHAVYLMSALARGEELRLGACGVCQAVVVCDRWSLRAPQCVACERAAVSQGGAATN
jgi:Flagellar transcriptional activator (FlhC)